MSEAPHWRFSHFGLFVKDLDRMVLFYKQVFSLVETDGGKARGHDIKFLSRDPLEHHQLVLESSRKSDETTVQQISFRFSSLDGLREMKDRLKALPKKFLTRVLHLTVSITVLHGLFTAMTQRATELKCLLILLFMSDNPSFPR